MPASSINAVSHRYWDVNLPMASAVEIAKKYPKVSGSILIEGMELAERHGLGCIVLHSGMDELRKIINGGIPPIVILPGISEDTISMPNLNLWIMIENQEQLHYILPLWAADVNKLPFEAI